MEIISWKKKNNIGQMVRVTREEALQIITSLSQQLLSRKVNEDRAEFFDQDGEYFSISVHDKSCNPYCPIYQEYKKEIHKKMTGEDLDFNYDLQEQNEG